MRTVLVTGGAGFIGSNFIPFFLKEHEDCQLVNLDLLTYAGDLKNLEEVEGNPRYHFVKGDICDRALVEVLFETYGFDAVFHFAAESHVDNSIAGPEAFIQTNVNGTFVLLDVARNCWMEAPFQVKKEYVHARFHHVSTDEVYGSLGKTGLFTEETPYAPNSPYSASKASSDMIVRSYFHTYGMNVVTTNCSNNYGPKQHNEKLIPTIIRKALAGEQIPVYGDGKNVRDWLYVLDHCKGIERVFRDGRAGETYNIGGESERENICIVELICDMLQERSPRADGKSYRSLISFVKDRPGHDRRYAIDISKINRELGWSPEESFETGLAKTVRWYMDKILVKK